MTRRLVAAFAALIPVAWACGEDPVAVADEVTIAAISPPNGAVGVDLAPSIEVTFSHPMAMSMSQFAEVHRGAMDGPLVRGTWMWSADRAVMRFFPDDLLEPGTSYHLHLGGEMRSAEGQALDYEHALFVFGGSWCWPNQMGMMHEAKGAGWRHANGSLGIVFRFTTG